MEEAGLPAQRRTGLESITTRTEEDRPSLVAPPSSLSSSQVLLDSFGLCPVANLCVAALKNADDMLKDIIKVVDTNGDGKIQYEGPHTPLPLVLLWSVEYCCGHVVGG